MRRYIEYKVTYQILHGYNYYIITYKNDIIDTCCSVNEVDRIIIADIKKHLKDV